MKIREILAGTMLTLATIGAGAAAAADLPTRVYKAPTMAAPVASTWTGCYIGAEGGGAATGDGTGGVAA